MGQPLISDATMRGIYETMLRLRSAKQDAAVMGGLSRTERAGVAVQPESLLAALLSQMRSRDTLVVQGSQPLLATALTAAFPSGTPTPLLLPVPGGNEECASVAAGFAVKQKLLHHGTGRHRVTVGLLRGMPAVGAVLPFMEEQEPSLVLVACGGDPESRAEAQRRLLGTHVPVLPVDQSDAVALCRVLQESMLRARSGWGGVLIHATALPGSADPLSLMEEHLRNRKLIP